MNRIAYFLLGVLIAIAAHVSAATTNVGALGNSQKIGWTDAGFKRSAAGQVQVTDGSTGTGDFRALTIDAYNGTNVMLRLAPGDGSLQLTKNSQAMWFSGTAVGAGAPDTGIGRYDPSGSGAGGVLRVTDVYTAARALLGGGAAVASATALPVPTGGVFHVTGTTSITSIDSTGLGAGVVVTLIFDGILTFTDGNNLKLVSNFVTTADDTITLAYDGTDWYEVSRSIN